MDREWARLTQRGLPRIERVPGRTDRFRVGFFWRPTQPVHSPSIYCPLVRYPVHRGQLRPLGRSGIWHFELVVPRGTRALYAFSPGPMPTPRDAPPAWEAFFRGLGPDPHNPRQLTMIADPDDPEDAPATVSVLELPGAPPQPWNRPRPRAGWSEAHYRLPSPALGTARSVWVYTPRSFDPTRRDYNLIVVFDGVVYQSMIPAPTIVANLVHARAIGPSVLVLVGTAPHARDTELAHNPHYAEFLGQELFPWLVRTTGLRPVTARTVLAGSSLGGLTAAYGALRYPELFGNVLAQSGAFLWSSSRRPGGPPALFQEFRRAPLAPTRFYLDAGTFERAVFPGMSMSLLEGVRRFRDLLLTRGYAVRFEEFEGGHDYACWGGTFADGLLYLLGSSVPGRRAKPATGPTGRRPPSWGGPRLGP